VVVVVEGEHSRRTTDQQVPTPVAVVEESQVSHQQHFFEALEVDDYVRYILFFKRKFKLLLNSCS
jgi:hypothetical protein